MTGPLDRRGFLMGTLAAAALAGRKPPRKPKVRHASVFPR